MTLTVETNRSEIVGRSNSFYFPAVIRVEKLPPNISFRLIFSNTGLGFNEVGHYARWVDYAKQEQRLEPKNEPLTVENEEHKNVLVPRMQELAQGFLPVLEEINDSNLANFHETKSLLRQFDKHGVVTPHGFTVLLNTASRDVGNYKLGWVDLDITQHLEDNGVMVFTITESGMHSSPTLTLKTRDGKKFDYINLNDWTSRLAAWRNSNSQWQLILR